MANEDFKVKKTSATPTFNTLESVMGFTES